jgi:single-strand DNA-binding protein
MASRSVNKVILLGNLGKDAETKFTPSGTSVSNFTLATNRRWKDQQSGEWKEETEWHRCVLWKSENRANYLVKGTPVYIEGRLQTRSWEDKEGQKRYTTEVVCEDLILLSGRSGDAGGASGGDFEGEGRGRPVSMPRSAQRPQAAAAPPAPAEEFNQGITDDDVPF